LVGSGAIRALAAGAAALCLLAGAAQAQCRLALALALDVSGSVNEQEYRLQLDGLAAALTSPAVARAVLALPGTPVALAVYEWSGPSHQLQVQGWTEIRTLDDLTGFAAVLTNHSRPIMPPETAVGSAMISGASLLAQRSDCDRRVLDITGDGLSNHGPRPRDVRDQLAYSDLVINALTIGGQEGDLPGYFRAQVILGLGAFVEEAKSFADFQAAMTRKLLRELAGPAVAALDQ